MTPEAQRIAIAEACGFTRYGQGGLRSGDMREWNHPKGEGWNRLMSQTTELPDFPGSLDAMHEAEKALTGGLIYTYQRELVENGPDGPWCMATAAHRAEIFLRTIGKWEESK